jgi:prepilin-type N-terminal cleavage/methylation domain-containing protein
VFGISKAGFTLIEILVALAIIALVATVVIPNLWQRKPYYERQQFIRNLNALSNMAWQKALTTHKIHKLQFDLARRTAFLQVESDDRDDKGEPAFVSVKGAYVITSFTWPKFSSKALMR